MARDITTNATVNLSVNGNDAVRKLDELRKKAESIKKELTELEESGGDPKRIKQLNKEWKEIQKQIRLCQNEVGRVNDIMRRLDTASPKELRSAIKTLNSELNALSRGSDAWNSHVAKIRLLQQQLDQVNASIRTQESRWSRMNRWLNDTQTFIMGVVAALTGMIVAGKSAVEKFMEMDQEMANVRKFTGMGAGEVYALNEEFKKIDTRSGREQLNALAQEAGRLGKQSQEDVLGFVKAADKINVALDDLGDGATLTLSKLTGIFGDERRLGTEKALLSVGSVINELSQNCSASAPYIAQFASRMGGVAAQAGMTVQQIMAFAAVLDTTNQGVEAASTALSQVITRLFQEPAKYAKVAGMDVEKFTDLLKRDTNAAVLDFLQTLNSAGGMDVLSPMFKDMGENGARAIAALSSLAEHIEEVKSQQEVANTAFREAVSIDKEFEVQNTTRLAQKEKEKKQLTEIAIELGEKLQPVLSHIYSSSSIMLRVLSALVTFLYNHKTAIITLTASVSAYAVAVGLATLKTKLFGAAASAAAVKAKLFAAASSIATSALNVLRAAVLVAQAAFFTLIQRTDLAAVRLRAVSMLLKTSPWGIVAAAVSAVAVAVYNLSNRAQTLEQYVNKLHESTFQWSKETVKQQRELDILVGKMKGAEQGTKEYEDAKNSIISQYGIYLEGLVNEEGQIINLESAYDRLTKAIQKNAMAKGIAAVEDKINEQYAQNISDGLTQLQEQLEYFGMEASEAAKISARVAKAIYAGEYISDEDAARINEFSAKRTGGSTVWQKAMSWLNNSLPMSWAQSAGSALGFNVSLTDKTPAEIYNQMIYDRHSMNQGMEKVESMKDGADPDRHIDTRTLRLAYDSILKAIEKEKDNESNAGPDYQFSHNVTVMTVSGDNLVEMKEMTLASAKQLLLEYQERIGLRGASKTKADNNEVKDNDPFQQTYSSDKDAEKIRKRQEAEQRRELLKKKKEFAEGLTAIEAQFNRTDAEIIGKYAAGQIDYISYLEQRKQAESDFYDNSRLFYQQYFSSLKDSYLEDDKDYAELLKKKEQSQLKFDSKITSYRAEKIKRESDLEVRKLSRQSSSESSFEEEISLQKKITEIRVKAITDQRDLYVKGSQEWERLNLQLVSASNDAEFNLEQKFAEKVAEMKKKYYSLSAAERYRLELQTLATLLKAGKISLEEFNKWKARLDDSYKGQLPGNGAGKSPAQTNADNLSAQEADKVRELKVALDNGLITLEEYEQRVRKVKQDTLHGLLDPVRESDPWVAMFSNLGESWYNLWQSMGSDAGGVLDNLREATAATFAVVNAGMQIASQFAQANAQIEINAIEKRYSREMELAQGNTYITAKLEKEKQQKIADAKNKAEKASFRMQVISAVGQAIQGSMNAYTSTAAIPVIGAALAPAAAAVALAAGMVNVALLKKQQEASASQGYSEGGFTKPGAKNEVAGVVHAGEWVASQATLSSPVARPLIELLERRQRDGSIASLSPEDVSMAIFPERSAFSVAMDSARVNNVIGSITQADASRIATRSYASQAERVKSGRAASPDSAGRDDIERIDSTLRSLSGVVARLADRLDDPIMAVTTVTGDLGIENARNEYKRLLRNKNRKKW